MKQVRASLEKEGETAKDKGSSEETQAPLSVKTEEREQAALSTQQVGFFKEVQGNVSPHFLFLACSLSGCSK